MKRHKPKHDRGRYLGICEKCLSRGVVYTFGTFTDYCKVDGTIIERAPAMCRFRQEEIDAGEEAKDKDD